MSEATASDYAALQQQYEFDVYPKRDLVLVRGRGATVWDSTGRQYIDAAGGYGVTSVGHCHPAVQAALARQSERLLACPGTMYCDVRARLLEQLAQIAPGRLRRTYLCNSGTEAVEAAIKFARFTTGRVPIVCAMRSFHGRTMGSLSATHNPKYKEDFGPLVPGFVHVPYNNLAKLEAAITEDTAGVLLEVVQGEGGVNPGDPAFLLGAQRRCRDVGALFIVDEVQTGFGRTGRLFASMHDELDPDIMTLAKGIAGGLPLGATMCADGVEIPTGRHGSTFAGSPLSCAAALATIGVILEEDLPAQAAAKGDALVARLAAAKLDRVRDIRHRGLMIGIQLKEKVTPILLALLERGVIALPAGSTVLRLLPPLVIGDEELNTVADAIIEELSTPAS
ncbi:MAG: aspartate aminotransferase family protein [Phycisphaerales bacterium]|nr:aspartate aminotransferase family protein [Phycisphaerae bacterium]NNF44663.1 aspartate aminotransferase family protein [Phycisphaerales bacterium]NNM26803.1 aspartate aminotransferase family protein [Phycisphaerales bacterium]